MSTPDPASLENLVDIVVPPPADLWPPAPGWPVLAVLAAAAALGCGWRWSRRWRADAYRREALGALRRLAEELDGDETRPRAVRGMATLLKRTALAAWPRREVAGLTGEPWLSFLQRTYAGSPFPSVPLRRLAGLAHAPDREIRRASGEDVRKMAAAVEDWIRRHRRTEPVAAPRPAETAPPGNGTGGVVR
jgi:hypothetical protein